MASPEPLQTRELELTYRIDDQSPTRLQAESWLSFCEKFRMQFLLGKGPQGRGIFKKSSCRPLTLKKNVGSSCDWRFDFITEHNTVSIQGVYHNVLIFDLHLPEVLSPARLFANPEALQFGVAQVYRRLPIAWKIKLPKACHEWTLPAFEANKMPGEAPVTQLIFFNLTFDPVQKIWFPKVQAIAKVEGDEGIDEDKSAEPYRLTLNDLRSPTDGAEASTLWAQELYSAPGSEQAKTLVYLADERPTLESDTSTSRGSAFASGSVRYFTPVPRGKTAATRNTKLELILRLAKGDLRGLGFTVERSLAGLRDQSNPSHFNWGRESLSWDIELALGRQRKRINSQLFFTPRLGLLTVDSYTTVRNADGDLDSPLTFQTRHQLELGAEIGWQLQRDDLTLSLSAMNNLSGQLLKKSGAASVSNQRLNGIFLYRSPHSTYGIHVRYEALASLDWLSLQNDQVAAKREQFGVARSGISSKAVSFNVLYLGLGLSLEW